MTHELVRRETTYSHMMTPERMAYANMLAGARDLIPKGLHERGEPSAAKIFLVLETGAMLGLEPMAALQGIDVIEGTATLAPRLVLALIRAAGYRVDEQELGTLEEDGARYGWQIDVYDEHGEQVASARFTIANAVRAGLCKLEAHDTLGWATIARSERGNPLPWEQYPEDMTFWRCVGRLARRSFSHVTLGIAYMPEELSPGSGRIAQDGTRAITSEDSALLIAELRKLDDRGDLAAWWAEHRNDEACTAEVRNALDAHLLTVRKDSRAADRPGAPGQTGIAELDQAAQPPADPGESPVTPEDPEPAREPDVEADSAAYERHVGEQIGDDPDWTGEPCPSCGFAHDASLHDAAEADAAAESDEAAAS